MGGMHRYTHAHRDLKEVSVKFAGFGRALPTLSFGLEKSDFFRERLRVDEPIVDIMWLGEG